MAERITDKAPVFELARRRLPVSDSAQKLANSDSRTIKLYDRSGDTVNLDEIKKKRF